MTQFLKTLDISSSFASHPEKDQYGRLDSLIHWTDEERIIWNILPSIMAGV